VNSNNNNENKNQPPHIPKTSDSPNLGNNNNNNKASVPPESVFIKLGPSRDRYSMKYEGELWEEEDTNHHHEQLLFFFWIWNFLQIGLIIDTQEGAQS
jgi:hypothetical protein